jgi:two-component system, OmpR family, sensor histidine kinase TctE
MEGARRPQWLTRHLLVRLMSPLLAIVAATAGLGIYTAHRLTDRVFDGWLLDAAGGVASLVRFEQGQASVELSPAAETVLLYDAVDRTSYSVMQAGRVLAGRRGIPEHGEHEVQYDGGRAQYGHGRVYEASLDGQPVRVARVDLDDGQGQRATVLVAETLTKRESARRDLEATLLPMSAMVLAAATAIVLAVRFTLRPLEAIATRWKKQSTASLQPIDDRDVPRELTPFASALNDLLARMRAMLARERQFATNAAHQLRTPLAGLQLGLARAAEAPDISTAREAIGELSRSTQRTARLVQQLLTLGRVDPEARGEFDFRDIDLVALAQHVGEAYADQALAKDLDLELIAEAQPVVATVQPELMAEALANLLDNAIRYTPAGGRVRVEVLPDPVRLRISDSGLGIAEDERRAVFERFVRGRRATGDGSGLGLAIVRDIAALLDAQVDLSDSQWGGLSATITLAQTRRAAPAAG